MVVPVDTCLAQSAVTAPRRADHKAIWAETRGFKGFEQLQEVHTVVTFDYAGV